jgi:signal transduction histidine kinase
LAADLELSSIRVRSDAALARWRGAFEGTATGAAALVEAVVARCEGLATTLDAALAHADERFAMGLGVDALVREYASLRQCLHDELDGTYAAPIVDHAVDEALACALARHVARRDEMRDRFVGILMHDLRAPLWTITVASELLGQGGAVAKDRVALERIRASAARMQRMVTDVLGFARANLTGDIPISRTPEDLGAIVTEVVDEVRMVHGEQAIRLALSGDLRLEVDRDRALQAVANVVRNAFDHGAGGVRVRVAESHDGSEVVLTVENLGKLRKPVVVASGSCRLRPRTGGHGLGLYIVELIARAHGARVDLGTDDESTTFTIAWPRT